MLRPFWRVPVTALTAALALAGCSDDGGASGADTETSGVSSTDAATDPATDPSSTPSSPGDPDPTTTAGSVSESLTGTTDDPDPTTPDPTVPDPTTPDPSATDPDPSATDPDPDTGETDTTDTDTDTGDPVGIECLTADFVNQGSLVIDYAQYDPVIGSHCKGTNHQDITDIERVVFLGDSVTVGTPPTGADDAYRSQLADLLVDRFGLMPPNLLWKQYNPIDGVAVIQDSGDFSSCSKWGARTDDFKPDMGGQVDDCFPVDLRDKRTLVVFTMGGNDLAAIAKDGADGKPLAEVQADAEAALALLSDTLHWFIDDPDKFPNGVFVVFANVYEFTDGTGDLMSCPAAGLGGFDKPWENPEDLRALVLWLNEQIMSIAVETGTDMIFMLENFCGHGFKAGDPMAPCYRGPGQENYFDLTCIHPTPMGHTVITDLFSSVIDE